MVAKETADLPRMGEDIEFVSAPRYIPLPDALWALRHRFPTVTRSVLLQCVRCHRWVAQPVTESPPDEVPTCPTPKKAAAIKVLKPSSSEQQQHERKRRPLQNDKDESRDEWRSPRLRQHYDKVVDVVKPTRQRHQDEPQEIPSYFIPNPANFTCQWIYCALEDIWADLRTQWLGDLYAAIDGAKGDEEGGGGGGSGSSNGCKGLKQHRLQQSHQKQDRVNEELRRELHGRRSERIARKPHGGLDLKTEPPDLHESTLEPSHSGRIAQYVNTLIHHDEAVVASFCWISCDSCGKLRRVHHPFPGGAPFICSLALNIESCSVPESEGLNAFFSNEGPGAFANRKIEGVVGDVALRDTVEAEASFATSGSTTATTTTGRRGSRCMATGARQAQGELASLELSLPFLRELTTALRKRALGGFVKNVMAIPQEVRAKREEVLRSSFAIAEGGSQTNSPPPKRDGGGSDLHGKCEEEEEEDARDTVGVGTRPGRKQKKEQESNGSHGVAKQVDTVSAVGQEAEREPRRHRYLACPTLSASCRVDGKASRQHASLEEGPVKKALPDVVERGDEESQHLTIVKLEPETKSCEVVGDTSSCSDCPNGITARMEQIERMSSNAETCSRRTGGKRHMRDPSTHEKDRTITSDNITKKSDTKTKSDNGGGGGANILDKRRGGQCAKRVRGRQKDGDSAKEEELEVTHWVCCDLCNKWRIVPEKIPEDTDHWHCVMRADGTTCDDTDDEVSMDRMKEQKRTRRKSENQKKR